MSRIHEALRKAEESRAGDQVLSPPLQVVNEPQGDPFPKTDGEPSESAFDRRDHSATQLSELLNLQCESSEWNPDTSKIVFATSDEHCRVQQEQFRALRSRLYQLRATRQIKTLLLTSSVAREGKTFIAANLSQLMGQHSQCRTLLIDADLRQPRLHTVLGTPLGPGLADYLSGRCEESEIIRRSPYGDLFFTPAGGPVENAGDLVASSRLRTFIARVSSLFDWVILDSPPAVPVTDASVLADACDGVILVIHANSTPFDVAQKARDEFRRVPILGVVLNRISQQNLCEMYYKQLPDNRSGNQS